MTFKEVVEYLRSRKDVNQSFIGLFFRPEDGYFGYYEAYLDEDLEWIGFLFEGGFVFSSEGEEESYSLDEVPQDAKTLIYRNAEGMPCISGMVSEYALKALFPALPNPEYIYTESDKLAFIKEVAKQFCYPELTP